MFSQNADDLKNFNFTVIAPAADTLSFQYIGLNFLSLAAIMRIIKHADCFHRLQQIIQVLFNTMT